MPVKHSKMVQASNPNSFHHEMWLNVRNVAKYKWPFMALGALHMACKLQYGSLEGNLSPAIQARVIRIIVLKRSRLRHLEEA